MNLSEYRQELDGIDQEIKKLFLRRMEIAKEIAIYKEQNNLPVLNRQRERDIVFNLTTDLDELMSGYLSVLYCTLFEVSRSYQNNYIFSQCAFVDEITNRINNTPKLFPKNAVVACQGIEGAYSQFATEKLFQRPDIKFFPQFDQVFKAVENGECDYGVLPIENNVAGSVTAVYDLMKKHEFYIVKRIKCRVDHALLGPRGAKLEDIKEVISHPQALAQCERKIKESGYTTIPCSNTAIAARMVAEGDRTDLAAIAQADCADIYGMSILDREIGNSDNNYTRFICISKNMEIYPGASKISLMFSLSHNPGSLYEVIAKFSALEVNITKLESRPIPGKDFEFLFYVDIDASVYRPEVISTIQELQNTLPQFILLGCYTEA